MERSYPGMFRLGFFLIFSGLFFSPANASDRAAGIAAARSADEGAYPMPEVYKEQWKNIQKMLTDDYQVCIEHCGNDEKCVDQCGRTFESKRGKEYQKLLYKDVQEHASCPLCGMDRAQYAHSRVFIEYDDGSAVGTCSLHCAVIDRRNQQDKGPKKFWVGDYSSKTLVDAHKAYWVIGGKVPGVMTQRAKWAFENKADAEAFIRENGGSLVSFADAVKAAEDDREDDTAMIQNKRATKTATAGPVMPSEHDKCPVCGMFVYKYPQWVTEIIFIDGGVVFFDGVKDLFKYYFDINKFKPEKSIQDIKAIYVTEYYSTALIKADEAFYVIGSDVYGPMGVEMIPLKTKVDAEQFLKDHQGKRVLQFKDITPKVIRTLPAQ